MLGVYKSSNREETIPNPLPRIELFHPKIFSLETTIVGEGQEQLGSWTSMDESSISKGIHVDKGIVILHLQLTLHLESSSQSFQRRFYDQSFNQAIGSFSKRFIVK